MSKKRNRYLGTCIAFLLLISTIGVIATFPHVATAATTRTSTTTGAVAHTSGLTVPLSLYINGNFKEAILLTSKFGWFYGSYPFTNTLSDGTAHHFYDETRAMLGYFPFRLKTIVG